jgi:hypothetical protein
MAKTSWQIEGVSTWNPQLDSIQIGFAHLFGVAKK